MTTVRIFNGIPVEGRHIRTFRLIAEGQIEVKVFDGEPFVLTPREALSFAKDLRKFAKAHSGGTTCE